MNPLLVIVLGWLALGLETSGIKEMLSLHVGTVAGAPSFVVPVMILIAICAPPNAALWSALVLGLFCDLTDPQSATTGDVRFIIGPSAIGFVLAAQFVVLVRGMVIRRNPLTLVVLSIAAGIIAAICTVAMITVRQLILHDPIEWSAKHELITRLFSALVTGGSALVMSFILLPLTPLLGLPTSQAHIRTRR